MTIRLRKSAKHLIAVAASFLTLTLCAGVRPAFADPGPGWHLVFDEEFDGTGSPDPSRWAFDTGGGGFGNDEAEHYTDRVENARVENGNLVIEARKEDFGEEHYTSAKLHTRQSWLYGHVEVRARLPRGAGTWPAIWMMPDAQSYGDGLWPDNGEIDIMEHVGRDPGNILGCFYTKAFNWMNDTGKTVYREVPDLEDDYHVFSLDWEAERMTLSVDGIPYNTFENSHKGWEEWPFDKPFHLILNLALAGFGGDIDDAFLPQKYQIDYVRVYQRD